MTLRSLALLALVLPSVHWSTGCSEDECGGGGGIAATYADPFENFQDMEPEQSVYEVEQLATGEERLVEVTIHNPGADELELLSLAFTADSDTNWTFDDDDLPQVVAPGGSTILEVHYTAQGGPDTYAIAEITTNDPHPNEEITSIGFHGVSSGELAEVTASPPEVDFGFTFRGEEVRTTFAIRNAGTAPLEITDVVLEGGAADDTLFLSCPQATILACNWRQAILPILMQAPIGAGDAVEVEVAFTPTNQQAQTARIVIHTTDPQRPELPVLVRGNSSQHNCTTPEITSLITTGPLEYTSMQSQDLEIALTATDSEQPINSIIVDLLIDGEVKEDAFTDATGLAEFDLDLANTDPLEGPVFSPGLHTIRLEAKDSCLLIDATTLVARFGGTLSSLDGDGDGYGTDDNDCDDGDPTSYPGAVEIFDGVDNDCDGTVDNDTEVWDDDCDGYCESNSTCIGQGPALDGGDCAEPLAATPYNDCNDSDRDDDDDEVFDGSDVHPNAEEGQNRRDDDCDGIRDEGTNNFDDDGDGFSEATGDCDDDDPLSFGGAGGGFEYCDQADNDCDGETDENCFSGTAAPRIVGPITLSQFEAPLGIDLTAGVVVLSEDPNLSYAWTADIGTFPDGDTGASVVWTAPEPTEDNLTTLGGRFANLIVTVTDSEGRSTQGFTEVLLWVGADGAFTSTCGCSTAQAAAPLDRRSGAAALLLVLASMGLRVRTRRRPNLR